MPPSPETIPDHDLVRPIGRGSYGEVWLTRHRRLGTLRAVKIIRRDQFENDRPFQREFEGIRRYEPISRGHPNLVAILHVGGAGDRFFYVMELADTTQSAEGASADSARPATNNAPDTDRLAADYSPRTLRDELKSRGRLPVADAVGIGLGLASALDHLHGHHLVHRDVKPSNVIFVNGVPKLADIGLVADMDEARSFVGTQGFIPPEGPGTPRADLYSLGKVLYEVATGLDRQEFPKLPPNLRELPEAEALAELNEIVLKACEDDPERRYASAKRMRDELALLQAGKSILRLRLVERRLALFNRMALAVLALLVAALGLYWGARGRAQAVARQLYVAEMNLAYQAWEGGNMPRARALLDKHKAAEPGLPGFEWRLLGQLSRESDARFTLTGHTGMVWGVAISPDGQRLASAGVDGTLKIWKADTGALLASLSSNTNPVHTVAFSPDGRTLASGGRDQTVTLRDAASFEVRHRLRSHKDAVRTLAFSPDGRRLASGGEDQRIFIWDAQEGRMIDELAETMTVEHLDFSPDGSFLAASGNDVRPHWWDLAKREQRALPRQQSLLKTVAFSPDGSILAAAGYDGATVLWDTLRGQSLGVVGGGAPVLAAVFSPDGQWLAAAGADAAIHVWSVESRRRTRQLRGHTADINALAFSSNGAWLASASGDGTVRVWEMHPPSEARGDLRHSGLVNAIAFAPRESRLAAAAGEADTLWLWDTATGAALATVRAEPKSVWSLAWAPDGSALFVGGVDGALRRWDLSPLQPEHSRQVHDYAIESIALSPDGRLVGTACRGAPIQLWDAATLEPAATLPGAPNIYRALAFSPDGRWLAAGGRGPDVPLWNGGTRALAAALKGHASEVRCVTFSPDSAVLAVADDGRRIHLWDVGTWRLRARLEGHDAPIQSLSFSPDGKTLASGSEDSTVKLWNLELGQEVATLHGHASQVRQVLFAPDGDVLASAGGDGLVRLWRAGHAPK